MGRHNRNKQGRLGVVSGARPLLSVAMIARNEEAVIGRAIDAVRPVAEDVVVMDTGSTDRTAEVARAHGARVYPYRWNHHFGEARTASVQRCRGKYVMWMDADETVLPEDLPELRMIAEVGAYDLVTCQTFVERSYRLPERHIEDFGLGTLIHRPRLMRNMPRLEFRYRVHESIHIPLTRATAARSTVRIPHHGRMHAGKLDYYYALLVLDHRDDPSDPHAAVYLAGRTLQNQEPQATLDILAGVDLEKASSPNHIEMFHFFRARALVMLGTAEKDTDRRNRYYQQAMHAYSAANTSMARLMAAVLLVQTQHVDNGLRVLQMAHEQDPEHIVIGEMLEIVRTHQYDPGLQVRVDLYFQELIHAREESAQEAPGQPQAEEPVDSPTLAPDAPTAAQEASEPVPAPLSSPLDSAIARRPDLNLTHRGLRVPEFAAKRGVENGHETTDH